MAQYVYEGDNYRGGATGVQEDFDLREFFAQMAAQATLEGQDKPSAEQIERARGEFALPQQAYEALAREGMYSDADEAAILSSRVQNVNNTTKALQQNLNASLASRGQGGNAGAAAALGMAGQFNAAGQRGQAYADTLQEDAESKIKGLEGFTDIAGGLATLDSQATKYDVDSGQYMDLYDQYRNAAVGYDGAKWATVEPDQPEHYADDDDGTEEDEEEKDGKGGGKNRRASGGTHGGAARSYTYG